MSIKPSLFPHVILSALIILMCGRPSYAGEPGSESWQKKAVHNCLDSMKNRLLGWAAYEVTPEGTKLNTYSKLFKMKFSKNQEKWLQNFDGNLLYEVFYEGIVAVTVRLKCDSLIDSTTAADRLHSLPGVISSMLKPFSNCGADNITTDNGEYHFISKKGVLKRSNHIFQIKIITEYFAQGRILARDSLEIFERELKPGKYR